MADRNKTIDIARGIAIVAIVSGHVLRGLASAGILDAGSQVFAATDRALYMGHLSVFAFLSGLFVKQGIEKRGFQNYLTSRLALFVYLYVFWQVLQIGVKMLTASFVNSPVSADSLLKFWAPEGQLWFLPFLIIATALAAICQPWRWSYVSAIALPAALSVSLIFWGYDGGLVGTQGISLLWLFFLGTAIGFRRVLTATLAIRSAVGLAALMSGSAVFAFTLTFTGAAPPTVNATLTHLDALAGLVATSSAVVTVVTLALLLARVRGFSWLATIGQRSMEIFLAHIIAASGARIILARLGIDNPTTHIVVGILAGVVVPYVLWLSTRSKFPWLFMLPGGKAKDALVTAT